MHPQVRKAFDSLVNFVKEETGIHIVYGRHVQKREYVRIKSAISIALLVHMKAEGTDIAQLFDMHNTAISQFKRKHDKKYWEDEEYIKIYDKVSEHLKKYLSQQRAN